MKLHIALNVIFWMALSGISGKTLAQGGMFATASGNTSFSSKTPMENIDAENKKTQVLLNTTTGELAIRMNMRDFVFPNKLMQEHFNENYMESEKFSKATLKGKIEDFDSAKITSTAKNFTLKGDLTIHGKTKPVTVIVKISKAANGITAIGAFEVKPEDFDIEIPSMVRKKIADKIKISYNFLLVK